MKYLKTLLVLTFMFLFISVSRSEAYVRVRSYIRSNGTYVQSHFRTNSNRIKLDNWSYSGNTNPFTGKRGYKW